MFFVIYALAHTICEKSVEATSREGMSIYHQCHCCPSSLYCMLSHIKRPSRGVEVSAVQLISGDR